MPEGITSLPVNIITYKVNVNQWMRFKLNIEIFFFFKGMEEKKHKSRKKSVVIIFFFFYIRRILEYHPTWHLFLPLLPSLLTSYILTDKDTYLHQILVRLL